jgi:hypothetical protein
MEVKIMPNLIRGLPIAMAGKWKNGKVVYTNQELELTAKANNDMLNADIKTYEIPLILTHVENPDLPLLTNTVMGYVKNMYYKEVLNSGQVYVDVEVLDEFADQFREKKYRQFSWCRNPENKRVMHIAVVGNQAIPIANIRNAMVEFMSEDKGAVNVENVEMCTFEIKTKEDEDMKDKKSIMKYVLDKLFGSFENEEKEELSEDVIEKTEDLSSEAQKDVGEEKSEDKNTEDEKNEDKQEELSEDKNKDDNIEYLAEMEKKLKEEMSNALAKQKEELSVYWEEKLEKMRESLKAKEEEIENEEMEKTIQEFLSAGKITPASIEKLRKLYNHLRGDKEAIEMLRDVLQDNEFLSFDDEAITNLLKVSPRKPKEEDDDAEEDIVEKMKEENRKQAMMFVNANK